MSIRIAAVAALILGAAPLVHAQVASKHVAQLEDLVVTATRTAQPASQTLAATTVITHADIVRMQARSLQDVLRRTPGISITNQGGPGKLTSIFMRGTNSNHVLVLVDGVRYGRAASGLPAIEHLPVSQIKRIEIVRGPFSSLYGSGAVGGVIQIFTRDGEGAKGAQPYVSVTAGSHATYGAQVGLSEASENFHYNLSLSAKQSHGINACSNFSGCFVNQPDDDGYSRTDGSMRGAYSFANGMLLKGHYLHTDGHNEYDGSKFSGNETQTRHAVYGLTGIAHPLAAWKLALSIGASNFEAENYFAGNFVNSFETRRQTVRLQNTIAIDPDNSLIVGTGFRRTRLESTTKYARDSRHNSAAFLEYLGNWGPVDVQLSGRVDDNEQFGNHATGSAALGWHVTDTYKLVASYGTAFKAPTFNALYYPGTANPDLDPEKSESYEIGLDADRGWLHWSLHAYVTKIDDLIANDKSRAASQFGITCTPPFPPGQSFASLKCFTLYNVDKARIRGVEGVLGFNLAGWLVNLNATYMRPENRSSGPDHGNDLARRPRYMGDVSVDRRFLDRYSAGFSLRWQGSRYDDAANATRLDSFVLVGLRGSVDVTDAVQIQARVSNLFDEDYQTIRFYNQPGRTYYVTLRYHP